MLRIPTNHHHHRRPLLLLILFFLPLLTTFLSIIILLLSVIDKATRFHYEQVGILIVDVDGVLVGPISLFAVRVVCCDMIDDLAIVAWVCMRVIVVAVVGVDVCAC